MKQLLMAIAMGVGLTCFAAQNDTVISFSTGGDEKNCDKYLDGTTVKDGENYALVWTVAGQNFEGFNSDGTLVNAENSKVLKIASAAKDGRCPGVSFEIPAELMETTYNGGKFELFLLDTRAGGIGEPAVASGTSVSPVNAWGQVINPQIGVVTDQIAQNVGTEGVLTVRGGCTYADNRGLLKGESFVLVGYKESETGFGGLTCDCRAIGNGVKVVACFAADANGGCEINLSALELDQESVYELVAVDSRTPDGTLSKTWDLDDVVRPQFISAWGRVRIGDTADTIEWNAIKLGDNVFLKQFDFDPTPYLADGFAAVCDEGGAQVRRLGRFAAQYGLQEKTSWMVFSLPKAYVRSVANKELTRDENYSHLRDVTVPVPFTLDATYQFDAFLSDAERDIVSNALENTTITHADFNLEQTLAKIGDAAKQQIFLNWYMRAVPFFGWNCDFEVRFDAAVTNDTFILAGFYDYLSAWRQYTANFNDIVGAMGEPWIGSSSDHVLTKGEPFRLLKSYVGAKGNITVNYEEICTKVKTFLCGVYNDSPSNWGKTITVDLNMYPNTGRETEEKLRDGSSRKYTVGTYRYTFKGPLHVKFYENEQPLDDRAINMIHDGTSEIPLPELSGGEEEAFVGWSNRVTDVVYTKSLPAKTWATEDDPMLLWACYKAAKKVEVTAKTESGEDVTPKIKVTKEWLDTKVGEGTSTMDAKDIAEALNQPAEGQDPEKGLKVWETYVLGLDPTDPKSSIKVQDTNGQAENAAIVISTVQAPPPDSGFKVSYSLDKVEADEKTPVKTGDEQPTKDLKIDLEPEGDTPTGYYKMNVIVRPDDAPESEKIVKPSDNTIGVLKVETEENLVPIAVPWLSLQDGTPVKPEEIVDPRTLSEGDKLHVYNDNGVYSSWYIEDGAWKQVDQTAKVASDLSVRLFSANSTGMGTSVECGKGVWLQRKDATKPFYLVGQYNQQAKSEVAINPGSAEKAEYNLIAPTAIEKDGVLKDETDLNAIPSLNSEAVNPNDQLMIIRKGVPTYFRRGADGKWGYNKTKVTWVGGKPQIKPERYIDDTKVSIGLGLWYISAGGSPTVNWKEDEQNAQ